jgi:hypothetical protein
LKNVNIEENCSQAPFEHSEQPFKVNSKRRRRRNRHSKSGRISKGLTNELADESSRVPVPEQLEALAVETDRRRRKQFLP